MRTLAADRDLRQRLGRAGRERVLREFSWERNAQEFEQIYRELVRRK